MPRQIKSKKQYNFLQMMAHNPEKKNTKGAGPSPEIASKMIHHMSSSERKKFRE